MVLYHRSIQLIVFTSVVLFLVAASGCNQTVASPSLATAATNTSTPEPVVPTRTPAPVALSPLPTETAVPTPISPASPTPSIPDTPKPTKTTPTSEPTAVPQALQVTYLPIAPSQRNRFGLTGDLIDLPAAQDAAVPFSHYLGWGVFTNPSEGDYTLWQVIRISEDGIRIGWEIIEQTLSERPGSFWVVGNEPDVRWQDNVTAERYAEIYHEVYTFIKERDPTAQVVIGGISQPTPLRLAYLDRILETYQALYGETMPVDVWNIHAFVLREELDSWGIGIPPGMDESTGLLLEIPDHGNIDLFRQYIVDFRAWMAARGYADKPLAVTEMGILLPFDYGFPPEIVADYMRQVFDFLLTAANDTGYPADDGRLVQYWFWYSLHDPGAYPTGNLYDRETQSLTPLGQAYRDYFSERFEP